MGPGAAKATPGVISEPRQDRGKGLRARGPSRCDRNGSPRSYHAGGRPATDDAGGLSRRAILWYGYARQRRTECGKPSQTVLWAAGVANAPLYRDPATV